MLSLFAQADSAQFWNQLFSGQVGFILATLVFGAFYTFVLLPREDRRTKAIENLADAVRMLVVDALENNGSSPKDIVEKVDKLRAQ